MYVVPPQGLPYSIWASKLELFDIRQTDFNPLYLYVHVKFLKKITGKNCFGKLRYSLFLHAHGGGFLFFLFPSRNANSKFPVFSSISFLRKKNSFQEKEIFGLAAYTRALLFFFHECPSLSASVQCVVITDLGRSS